MTGRRLTDAEKVRIVKLRRRGLTLKEIARKTGRSCPSITEVLRTAGMTRGRAGYRVPVAMKARCAAIVTLAQTGISEREVALQLGLRIAQIRTTSHRYSLRESLSVISTLELGDLLGITDRAVKTAIHAGHLPYTRWFRTYVFTPEQVEAAQAAYAETRTLEEVEGWLTSEQVAAQMGVSLDMFQVHRNKARTPEFLRIRMVRVVGVPGRMFRYHPWDTLDAAAAWRARPKGRPTCTSGDQHNAAD